jgi:hypothetical protein
MDLAGRNWIFDRFLAESAPFAVLPASMPGEVQARYEDLAERNTDGRLSPTEQEELALMVRTNALLTVLKAEARAFLQHPTTA